LDKPSGAAFSNPYTRSELARDCENTSPTRSASGPVLPATRYSLLVTRALSAFVCLLAVAGLCWFLTWEILIFFGVWLLGASASLWTKRVPPWWLAACFLIPILIVARAEILKVPYGWQYLLGVAFALVIVSLANGSRRWFFSKPSAYLADFSYSVYLIHFPVLMFVTSAVFSLTRYGIKIQFDAIGLIWFVAVFQLTILLAWVVSLFTERKTEALRLRLYKAIKV
jgi:peptidoglycan/LPS O-acetylase OafA/YrhL